MTSWFRKQIRQHQELRTPKFKMRVAPLVRNEKRKKAIEDMAKEEMEELDDDSERAGGKAGDDL